MFEGENFFSGPARKSIVVSKTGRVYVIGMLWLCLCGARAKKSKITILARCANSITGYLRLSAKGVVLCSQLLLQLKRLVNGAMIYASNSYHVAEELFLRDWMH